MARPKPELVAFMIVAPAVLTSCGLWGGADEEELRAVLGPAVEEVVDEYNGGLEMHTMDTKFGHPYVRGSGQRQHGDADDAVAALQEHLGDSWEVVTDRPVDFSLGHETVLTDDELVIRMLAGEGGGGLEQFPALDDGVHVSLSIANEGADLDWADIDD